MSGKSEFVAWLRSMDTSPTQNTGGFLVPAYLADYLIAFDAYQKGLGPKPGLPVELRRTRWQVLCDSVAGRLGYWGDAVDRCVWQGLDRILPDLMVDLNWSDRIAGWISWPIFALARWVARRGGRGKA